MSPARAARHSSQPRGRLLLVSEYFPPRVFGGGELSALLLARGLGERGFEVWVLTSAAEGLPEREQRGGVEVVRRLVTGRSPASVASNLRRVLRLPPSIRRETRRLAAERRFDAALLLNSTSIVPLDLPVPTLAVVNGYTPFCPKGNLFLRERGECRGCAPRRFVSCILRSRYAGRSRLRWFLRFNPLFWVGIYLQYRTRRRALAGVDRFVAISGFVREVLESHGVDGRRIDRIYNIARIEDSSETPAALEEATRGREVTSVIGGLEKIKGTEVAIRAFTRRRSPSDLLLLVGDGSERRRLEKLCRRLGLDDAVHFTGHLPASQLPFVYRRSRLVVAPALWPEPFSRVVMETARFGRPLLASSRGGNRDLPAEHLFAGVDELADKMDGAPVPDFAPYDPEVNLDRFVDAIGRLTAGSPAGGSMRESSGR